MRPTLGFYTRSTPPPTSFAGGRYQVQKFLGEGGKKKVYLAHDTVLDRDVTFALIKTEKLDQTSRQRIRPGNQGYGEPRRPSQYRRHFRYGRGERSALCGPAPYARRGCGGFDREGAGEAFADRTGNYYHQISLQTFGVRSRQGDYPSGS